MQRVSPNEVGVSTQRLRRVDTAIQRYIDEGKIAGLVTMLARRGKIFYTGCYGMADIERQRPMQTNSIFRMASISKMITAVALMILYEEGHFVLDQNIGDFLPAFQDTKVYVGMDGDQPKLVDKVCPITVRQLMLHTAGFPSVGSGKNDSFPEQKMRELMQLQMPPPKIPINLTDMVDMMARIPLAYQPNTKWLYGPTINIGARLIEVITGKSFNTFLQERLFEPLGMTDSGFIVSNDQIDRFCTLYAAGENAGELKPTGLPEKSWEYVPDGKVPDKFLTSASGGMVSTPDDMIRFSLMLANRGQLDGIRVLAPRTVDLMATNHLPPHLLHDAFDSSGYGYGLGCQVVMDNGLAGLPEGSGTYWKDGSGGVLFWVDPQHELTGIVLYQLNPSGIYPVLTQMRTLTYQAMEDT